MKKAMFSKFTSILQHAVDALAPQLSMQEEFVLHWKAVTGFFIDNKGEKMPVEQTTIPSHLEQMLVILQQEDQEVEGGMYGPCLEYLLQHKLLETLYSLGRTDYPPGMKQMVLSFFTKLLSRVKKPILAHVNVYRAVQRMIKTCGEVKAAPTEIEEIQFLCTVCAKIKGDPYLVNFFLEMPKPSQSTSSGPGVPVQEEPVSENKLVQEFHLVTTLLILSHSEDSRVAVKACEGLILCSSLPEPIAAHCMINSTNFCDDLTQRLVDTYIKLPETINPVDLEFVQAKWGMDVITEREDKQTFTGKRHLVSFLSWLDFCDQLSTIANPIVAEALARTIHQKFLLPYFKPALLQMSESGAITSVAYLTRCFRTVCSQRLLSEFALFVIGEDRRPEGRDSDQTMLRSRLIENCNNVSEEMCLVALQLFDTLLQKDDEHILHNLVIRNLERRHYCKAKCDISDGQSTRHMIGGEALCEFEKIAKSQGHSQIKNQAKFQAEEGIQSEAKSQKELESEGVTKSLSESKNQNEEETQNEATSQNEAPSQGEVEAQTEVTSQNEAESQNKVEEQSEEKSQIVAESQSEVKAQNVTESQSEAKSQVVAESQNEAEAQNVAESQNEVEAQNDAKSQNEAESLNEAISLRETETETEAESHKQNVFQNADECQPGAMRNKSDICDIEDESELKHGDGEKEVIQQTIDDANTNCLPVQSECPDSQGLPTSTPEIMKCENPNFSPVYSKTEVHKIVNSFLSLLPEELKSSYQTADSGYDMYLRDAHRQYTSMLEATKNWGYPIKCGPLPTETETFYEGSFLHMLLDKLTHILDQSYPVNLQLTSVISKLALVPHPYLHEFLLDPFLPVKPGVRTLYIIFQKVASEIKAKFEAEPDLSHKLILVRKKLMGNSSTGQRYFGNLTCLPLKKRVSDWSNLKAFADGKLHEAQVIELVSERSDGQNELEAIIVLEEFCKELSAIAFVKHHAAVTGDRS